MLPDGRRAKTLVVVQGLTRQAIRCLNFSFFLGRDASSGHGLALTVCLGLG
jgi:hypothetical protein